NYDDDVLLSTTASYLREFLSHASERRLEFLDGKSKEERFAYVYDIVCQPTNLDETSRDALARYVPEQLLTDWTLHSRLRSIFHLNDVVGSTFDKVRVILINDGSTGMQRLIWRDRPSMRLFEVSLPDQIFDEVARQFLSAFANE